MCALLQLLLGIECCCCCCQQFACGCPHYILTMKSQFKFYEAICCSLYRQMIKTANNSVYWYATLQPPSNALQEHLKFNTARLQQ